MTNNNSEDVRIKKTKKKLFVTFVKLLEEVSIESITINDLCSYAGVRRATFYKHFSDKIDFYAFVINQLRNIFDTDFWRSTLPATTPDYYIAYASKTIDFLDEYGNIVNKLLDSSVVPLAMQLIIHQNFLATYERLVASSESGMKFTESPQIVAMMLAGGVATTILNWLKNRQSLSKEDFIKELSGMIRRILEP